MKNQICILISAFLLTLAASPMTAQEHRQDGNHRKWEESMRAEKIAYFTEALELSTEEAEKFWPVYNMSEQEEHKDLHSKVKELRSRAGALQENKSDNEISSLLKTYIDSLDKRNEIDRKYIPEYQKIISDKKVAKLFLTEEYFRRHQLHKLKKGGAKPTDSK